MSFELRGQREMQQRLRDLARRFPKATEDALYLEGEKIMTKSKQDYVPVDDGTLRSSGHVKKPERRGKEVSVRMVYGGSSAPYALTIHENPSVHDPPTWRGVEVKFHPDGRGPKYLQKPMNEAIPGMSSRIAAHLESQAD